MTAMRHELGPVIVCEHVSVSYGRSEVLHDVSLEVPRGAFLPFIGPNGAGKTTLLRTIVGLLKPTRGKVLTPFGRSPPGYVPQRKAIDPLYPLTTRQIVAMGLYPRLGWWRRPTKAQREEVEQALAQFGLGGHGAKAYGELSGGMQQKALLARAFVSDAEVFVMDEPTSELDARSEQEVLTHLHQFSEDGGKTVLLAHHGLNHVAELAPVLCLVDHGRARLVDREHLGDTPPRTRRGAGDA